MKTLSITAQWVALAGLVAFVLYVLWRPAPQPDYTPDAWCSWEGATVLSYPGIARESTPVYPSVKRLEAQLSALHAAGYRTVRPEDLRAFLDEQAPLPKKALLLIFEGGRKEAFIRATPILQRTGFTAVIAIPTAVMTQWGSFYLKNADIRKVVKLPQWQVGSMGHRAASPLPGSENPDKERFLAQRIMRDGEQESVEAFRERILDDYARSACLLTAAIGQPAALYLYPFGEAGQSPGSDPFAEEANRGAVTRHYQLAFIGSANPFNGPNSDPWSLTRLRVPGDWSPERLLEELKASRPRPRSQPDTGTLKDWVFEHGGDIHDRQLRLLPNAVAWLRGTEAWRDSEIQATLHPDATGTAALYTRHTGTRSWLRVTCSPAEGIRVQERLGGRLHTLYSRPSDGPSDTFRIRLRVRNNRAWLWLNGQPLAENLPLSPDTRVGRIGVGSSLGILRMSEFSARPLPARWVLANSLRLVPEDKRDAVQAILPNWFRAGEPTTLAQTLQQDLLQAAVIGIRTVPLLEGGSTLDETAARAWAAAVDEALGRANLKMLVPDLAVEGPAFALAEELRNRDYRITHLLSPSQADEWGRSIIQAHPKENIAIKGSCQEMKPVIARLLRGVPESHLARQETPESFLPGIVTLCLGNPDSAE